MLNNKRAGVGMPLVAIYSMFILFFVIIFFLTYFFVLGGAKAAEVTISSEEMPKIQKLPNLLATNLSQIDPNEDPTKTLYDLIIEAQISNSKESQEAKQRFHNNAIMLTNKMKLKTPSDVTASWNIIAYDSENGNPIEGLIVPKMPASDVPNLGASPSNILSLSPSYDYFNEFLLVPIPGQKPITLRLYLSCSGCKKNYYIGGYA